MLVLTIRGIVLVTAEGDLTVFANLDGQSARVGFVASQGVRIIRFDVLENMLLAGLGVVECSPQELPGLHVAQQAASEQALAELKASYQSALDAVRTEKLKPGALFAALTDPNVLEMLVEFHA